MMHEITKDGCLLVDRHQRLADVCRKLRSPSISTIAVCGKNGQIQGYIPLWHILQLLKENRAFIDQRIAACTVRQISEALQRHALLRLSSRRKLERPACIWR